MQDTRPPIQELNKRLFIFYCERICHEQTRQPLCSFLRKGKILKGRGTNPYNLKNRAPFYLYLLTID